jgi:hypothetical protein
MTTKQFTKKDLKTGYHVHFSNHRSGVILLNSQNDRDIVCYFGHSGWDELSSWNDDLTTNEDYGNDIIKVTKTLEYQTLDKVATHDTIWERPTPKTKEQLAYEQALDRLAEAQAAVEALNPSNK